VYLSCIIIAHIGADPVCLAAARACEVRVGAFKWRLDKHNPFSQTQQPQQQPRAVYQLTLFKGKMSVTVLIDRL